MECLGAPGGMVFRPFNGEWDSMSSKTRAAIAQIGRCGRCKSPLDPDTALCPKTLLAGEPHDSIFVAEAELDAFEELIGVEKRRNKDKRRARRRADAMRDVPGFYTEDDIAAIRKEQRGECYYCGTPLTRANERRDHMTPVAAGGSEWPSNIALACVDCNHSKSARGAIAFWNHLRKTRGETWVMKRQSACKSVETLKSKLTKRRKDELNELCSDLRRKLNDGVRKMGAAGKLHNAGDVYIVVEPVKDGIEIQLENIALLLPASAHRRMRQWVTKQWPQILNALLELESTMGTILLSDAEASAKNPAKTYRTPRRRR